MPSNFPMPGGNCSGVRSKNPAWSSHAMMSSPPAARAAARAAGGEEDRPAALGEFFSDLATRLRTADDEYGAGGERCGMAILATVKLRDAWCEIGGGRWDFPLLKETGCDH